jgi:hypothetical protein
MAKFGIDSNMVFDADGKSVATRLSDHDISLARKVSLLTFENLKIAVSGGWDYGPCLQAAIDSLAPDTTNGYYYPQADLGGSQPNDSKPGGIVVLPPGVFPMSNVKLRSHVSIEGSGKYATRIQAR